MKLTALERTELSQYLSWYDFTEQLKNATLLITGSKGIVGTGLIKWLLLENELHGTKINIIASTRTPEARPNYLESTDPVVFCKFGEEKIVCEGQQVDYIIHGAAPTGNKFFDEHPVEALRVIVDGTENALEIASEKKVPMVYLSSEEVYGLPDLEVPLDEEYIGALDSLNTRSCYPLGKKTGELLCKIYSVEYGTNVKIIRPSVIHGLFQKYKEQRLVGEILRCVLENKDLVMKSAGLTKKCLIYSLDAISAILTVLFKGEKGEAYNATNPKTFMTVKELAEYIFSVFNPGLKVVFAEQDTSVSEGYLPWRSLLPNINKLKHLGWGPKIGLEHIYEVDVERFEFEKNTKKGS